MAEESPIERCWALFRKEAIPEHSLPGQLESMKMAFLAGCDTILQLELQVREREASYRRKLAFTQWADHVRTETAKIADAGSGHTEGSNDASR